ncbi:MAG: tyrosine-protein phosphatase [Acidobacteria bacterium]|nr:tyrosine-protein phosphatase [Acidobacteriota bacterium]
MRRRLHGSVFTLFILLLLAGPLPATWAGESADIPEKLLPRFRKVDESLYRGGMPEEEGFHLLKKMGIKTVVNFRNDNDERQLVESLGMKNIHIPLTAKTGIDVYSIREFFKVLGHAGNYPVFVHCRRGADRTGAMIAFYRIAFQGWDPERAYREARDIGLRWWYFILRKQIRNFNPESFSKIISGKESTLHERNIKP